MTHWKGYPRHIRHAIMGKITKTAGRLTSADSHMILVSGDNLTDMEAYEAVIFTDSEGRERQSHSEVPSVSIESVSDADFSEGDIVAIYPSGVCILLYRTAWHDITLFFTNQCNSRCIMCPQIADEDPGDFLDMNEKLLALQPAEVEHIGITGGEPTVYPQDLKKLIGFVYQYYPDIPLSLLTNGRAFRDLTFVRDLVLAGHKHMMFCIPLYASNYEQHDGITGAPHSFQETIQGIYNLYRLRQLIEIRVVVFKYNARYLGEFAHFIYRNMPFVRHVVFMGMEYTGRAAKDKEKFWIDPFDYKESLDRAVWYLHQRGMNVSIYNIPLCLLNIRSHRFSRDSISSWKKKYENICDTCKDREHCSGEFATSVCGSPHIHPWL